uniref:3-isopropylmalate dehydrogenase (EC) n=1 Tax=Ganoderma boninense TaxID=34458 RepID=A0A5K1JRN4_9APHY|nr:3-isopropylmalate dehydrogenase (EC [Ganoderma boninense]
MTGGVQIDDLEGPYTNYSIKYCLGFDTWEPVQANPRVLTVLAMFSSSCPPPLPPSSPAHPAVPPIWTLDELFVLPKSRIKYYKKLYNRLLKSTAPGRSDHRMLTGALEKLDQLLATIDSRSEWPTIGGHRTYDGQSDIDFHIVNANY